MTKDNSIKPRFDRFPLPWPPKPLVLALLGLDAKTATEPQYLARWYEMAHELQGEATALEKFTLAVDKTMRTHGLEWTAAWHRVQRTYPTLWKAVRFQEEVRQARGIKPDDWKDCAMPADLAHEARYQAQMATATDGADDATATAPQGDTAAPAAVVTEGGVRA